MNRSQPNTSDTKIPEAVVRAAMGIDVLDSGVRQLESTGLMHNHMRMWIASVTCNLAQTYWLEPAKWFHYHLLDGDLASNTLSWQWVAGTFSHKQYIANQDNVNKYSRTQQKGTWLDVDYETLATLPILKELQSRLNSFDIYQPLPSSSLPGNSVPKACSQPIALRSIWNLDPRWLESDTARTHVIFIEKEQDEMWPMSNHRWDFNTHWAKEIGAEIWHGSVVELSELENLGTDFVKQEYPASAHWPGSSLQRNFYFEKPSQPFGSFSQFWKQVK